MTNRNSNHFFLHGGRHRYSAGCIDVGPEIDEVLGRFEEDPGTDLHPKYVKAIVQYSDASVRCPGGYW
jgi:hypothetical protein